MAGGALMIGMLVGLAGPASAWTADATVSQTCVDGASTSTVHFSNNFDVPATVTYQGPVTGNLGLPPMVGSAPGTNTIAFTVSAPSTFTYRVTWDGGETQGNRTLRIEPINGCVLASTTTVTVVGVTVVSVAPTPPPTVTVPPASPIEAVPTTVVTTPSTSAPVAPPIVPEVTSPTARVAAVTPSNLPATGTNSSGLAVGGVSLIVVGAVLIVGGRRAERPW